MKTIQVPTLDLSEFEPTVSRYEMTESIIDGRFGFELAIQFIREVGDIKAAIDGYCNPHIKALQDAIDEIKAQRKPLTDRIDAFVKDRRAKAAAWQSQEDARLSAESEQNAIKAIEWTPFDGTPKPEVTEVIKNKEASLRKLPWSAEVEDENELWGASMEEPEKYSRFWLVNLKELKEEARQKGPKFNIPGCRAFQGTTLAIKRG